MVLNVLLIVCVLMLCLGVLICCWIDVVKKRCVMVVVGRSCMKGWFVV